MIIELHNSLVGRMEMEASHEGLVVSALDHLATAQIEGNHLLFGEVETLEMLRSQEWIHPRTKAVLSRTLAKFPQLANLSKSVSVKLIVGDFEKLSIKGDNRTRLIHCPVSEITSSVIQPTLVLVENIDDAKLYQWITNEVLRNQRTPDIILKMEAYPGGGDTTANVYEHLKRNTSRLCLCIVDSDIRCPTEGPGETASKVIKSDKKSPNAKTDHYVLGSCSLENLIPVEFYEDAWKKNFDRQQILSKYKPFCTDRYWPFLQLKKDIRCADLRGDSAFAQFWREGLACAVEVDACLSKPVEARCKNREKCSSIKLPVLAKKPLDEVLNHLTPTPIPYTLTPHIEAVWTQIARRVTSWCCASTQQAAM